MAISYVFLCPQPLMLPPCPHSLPMTFCPNSLRKPKQQSSTYTTTALYHPDIAPTLTHSLPSMTMGDPATSPLVREIPFSSSLAYSRTSLWQWSLLLLTSSRFPSAYRHAVIFPPPSTTFYHPFSPFWSSILQNVACTNIL